MKLFLTPVRITFTLVTALLLPLMGQAQYIGTAPVQNGVIGSGEYGTHTAAANQATSASSQINYMTWDATNLYVGVTNANLAESFVLYLDKDPLLPVNGGTNSNGSLAGVTLNGVTPALPFRADLEINVNTTTKEYRTANGSNGWNASVTSGITFGSSGTGNIREFSIPWSVVGGIPSSFNFYSYNVYTTGIYNVLPTQNTTGNGSSFRHEYYYTVTSTANGAATLPFSRACFVYNGTSNYTSFGAISVYDFTMNNASFAITRDAGSTWTIAGSLNVSAGTVSFGANSTATTIQGNVTNAGVLTLSSNAGGSLTVNGIWNSSGTFTPNGRTVTMGGSAASTITHTSGTAFSTLVLNNAAGASLGSAVSTGTLTLTSGTLTLGAYDLTVTGSVGSATSSKYVKTNSTGQLKQTVAGTAVSFPVGNSAYNPITLTNTGTSDTYGIRVVDGSPANMDATKAVLRSWVITEGTAGGSTLAATAQYNSGDVGANYNAGTTPYLGLYANSAWLQNGATLAGAGPFTAAASGFSPGSLPATSYFAIFKDQTLNVVGTTYTWVGGTVGAVSDWGTATNWSPSTGYPTTLDNVIVGTTAYPVNLNGNRTVADFAMSGTAALVAGAGESLAVNGSFSFGSSCTATLDATSTLTIAGSASQTIPALTYGNLNIAGGARVLDNSAPIVIAGSFTPGSGTITTTGTTVRFTSTAAGTIIIPSFTSTTANRSFNNLELVGGASTVFNLPNSYSNGVTGNLQLTGAGTFNIVNTGNTTTQTMSVGGNLSLSGSGTLTIGAGPFAGTLNVAGTTTVSAGTLVVTNTASTGLTNRLNTNALTISGTGRVNLEATSSSSNSIIAVTTDLLLTSTTAYALDLGSGTANGSGIADGNSVTIGGNLTKSGTGTIGLSGTYSAFAGVLFSGTGTQTLSHSGAGVSGGNIGVNTGSTLQLNSDLVFSSSGITGFAVIGRLNAGNYSVIAGNASSGFSTSGTGSVIASSKAGGLSDAVSGFVAAATAWPAGTGFEYTGSASQVTGFASYASALSNAYSLTWLGTGNLTLDASVTASTLALTNSGLFILGSNTLTMTSSGSITGSPFSTSKMIVADGSGSLLRTFTSGGTGIPFTFPIGDNTSGADYTPVTVGSLSATAGGTLGFRVTDAAETNIGAVSHYLTRYWTYSVTGGGSYSWGSATLTYTAGDVFGTESLLKANAYNSTNGWTEFANSSANSNVLTITSGPSNGSLSSGDNLTGRLAPVIADYYRTTGSGSWTSPSIWEVSTDPAFVSPAPVTASSYPTANNSLGITVQAGHTVSFSSGTLTVDQLTVASTATLTVSGGTFNLAGTNPALVLNGNLNLGSISNWASGGTVTIGSTGSLVATVAPLSSASMSVSGSYEYASTSGAVPTATWSAGSLLTISGVTNTAPTGLGQAFYDLVWNCPNQSTVINLGGGLSTANGGSVVRDFTLTSSNGQEVRLASTTSASLAIGRDLNISSGVSLTMLASTSSFTALASTLSIGRDLTIGGSGAFQQTGANATGTNTITTTVAGNVNMSTLTGVRLALSGTSTGVMSVAGNFSHSGSGTVRIGTGSGNQTMNVSGAFSMSGTATLDFTSGSGSITFNAYGDFGMPSGTTVSRSGGGTPTLNFLKSSGSQTWTTGGSLTTNALGINIGNNSLANTVVLTNNLTLLGGYINIQGGSTLDMGPYVISGAGSISQYFQGGLKIGHPQGIVASGTAAGNIQTTNGRNYNNGGYFTYTGTTNQVTGSGLPNSLQNSFTIANTGPAGNNTVTLTTAPTQITTLVLQSGLFAIGSGATANISNGGTVTSTGGDFATGAAGGTLNFFGTGTFAGTLNPYIVSTSGQLDFGAGTVTIQNGGKYILNSGGATLINRGPYYATGALLQYNSGSSYNRSNEWLASTGRGAPYHVLVGNNTSLKPGGNGTQLLTGTIFQCAGDLTVASGSGIDMSATGQVMTVPLKVTGNLSLAGTLALSTTLGGDLEIGGNLVNTGTLTPNDRAVTFNGSTDATLSGSTNTSFAYLIINKAVGRSLTATVPFTLSRSGGGLYRLQSGIWDMNGQTMTLGPGTNTLQIDAGTASGQTLKTGGTGIGGFSAYYNGTVLDSLGGKVEFSGSGPETLPAGVKGYTRLFLSGAGTKSLSQSIRVNDSLRISSGATLDMGASATVLTARAAVVNQGSVTGTSTGKLFMGGTASQTMSGSGTYRNLEIGNAADVYSSGRPTVTNSLTLTTGKVYTGADTLVLGSTATLTETIGASQNFVRGNLRTVRTVGTAAQSFGGMGVTLSAGSDLGTVFVNRQSGTPVAGSGVCCTAHHSIQRVWTITPSQEPAAPDRSLTLSWPSEEDNGQSMVFLQPWKSPDGVQPFSKIGNVQNGSATNPRTVVINNVPSFSVWTVADEFNPLPLGLIRFAGSNVKGVGQLVWEVNGREKQWLGFTVEKSTDGRSFSPIGYVEADRSQMQQRYSLSDRNLLRDSYYRLLLKGQGGSDEYSETVLIRAEGSLHRSIRIFPNPATTDVQIGLDDLVEGTDWVKLEIASVDGKQLFAREGSLSAVNQELKRQVGLLAPGLYRIRVQTVDQTVTQKLIKP